METSDRAASPLTVNDEWVEQLRVAIQSGRYGLADIPKLVKIIVARGAWRERVVRQTGQRVEFQRFRQFVSEPPLQGLGTDMETLRHLCRDDLSALDEVDKAEQRPAGRPPEINDNITYLKEEGPSGTNRQQALRRLRKDRPDLHGQVIAGEKSPHAAMVEAGFRPKTITVRPTPAGFIAAIRKHLSKEDIEALIEAVR